MKSAAKKLRTSNTAANVKGGANAHRGGKAATGKAVKVAKGGEEAEASRAGKKWSESENNFLLDNILGPDGVDLYQRVLANDERAFKAVGHSKFCAVCVVITISHGTKAGDSLQGNSLGLRYQGAVESSEGDVPGCEGL